MKNSRNSLTSLRIFISAANTLNFSRSAEALNLTQSAVSKHVGALEGKLGVPLFTRLPTGLRLTHAGAVYLEKVAAAMRLLDEADAAVAHPNSRVALNLAVSPSFAQCFLIPGLREFFALHPDVRVNVRPRLLQARGRGERFDAEVHLHTGHVSGMSAQYLCGRDMTLVASPSLLATQDIACVEDLDRVPLLKRAQRGYGWDEWKAEIAPFWAGPPATAPEYEGFSVLLPAVIHGLGAAIVPLCMVLEPLRRGELVRPLGETVAGRYAYYLLKPRPDVGGPYLDALCEWLVMRGTALDQAARDLTGV